MGFISCFYIICAIEAGTNILMQAHNKIVKLPIITSNFQSSWLATEQVSYGLIFRPLGVIQVQDIALKTINHFLCINAK